MEIDSDNGDLCRFVANWDRESDVGSGQDIDISTGWADIALDVDVPDVNDVTSGGVRPPPAEPLPPGWVDDNGPPGCIRVYDRLRRRHYPCIRRDHWP
jgi:hypothetical protein